MPQIRFHSLEGREVGRGGVESLGWLMWFDVVHGLS